MNKKILADSFVKGAGKNIVEKIGFIIVFILVFCNLLAEESGMKKIEVIIKNEKYKVELEKNPTTQKFLEMLPLELEMNELNGNEKYAVLPKNLPREDKVIKTIKVGDLMLYQNNYLVLFYKNFSSSYSYTRLGKIVETDKLSKNISEKDRRLKIRLIENN